jgi:hypothetical protein
MSSASLSQNDESCGSNTYFRKPPYHLTIPHASRVSVLEFSELPDFRFACGAWPDEVEAKIFLDAIGHKGNVRPTSRKGAHSNGLAAIELVYHIIFLLKALARTLSAELFFSVISSKMMSMIRIVSKNALLGSMRIAHFSAMGPGILPPPMEVRSFKLRTADSMGGMSKDNGILACAKVLRTVRIM